VNQRPEDDSHLTPDTGSSPGLTGAVGTAGGAGVAGGVGRSARGVDRDRRGRGMRGPAFGPGGPHGRVPAHLSRRERFDRVAIEALADIEPRWTEELADLELAVEDIPVLPQTWQSPRVPLAALVGRTATTPARLVLYRRPIEHRAETTLDLEALVLTVVVEQLAEFLGVPAEEVHPDYEE
jgi:predicted Zn-dependent protease with MMP-like domain